MEIDLTGKSAVITGASAGIGRGIAELFGTEGVRLAIVARRQTKLDEVADTIVSNGGNRPVTISADLTNEEAIDDIHSKVSDEFERTDIIVNSAGGSRKTAKYGDDAVWEEAIQLEFTARRRLTEAFLPSMEANNWGRVINITGTTEISDISASTSAKAITHAWAKGLSKEVGEHRITVNSIVPGRILSEQITERLYPTVEEREEFAASHVPLGYFADREEVANVVAFLSSEKGRYITGQLIYVDGGLHDHAF